MKSYSAAALLIILFFWSLSIKAQPSLPANGILYTDNAVPRIDILIHPDTLNWIYENEESDSEHRAVFVFTSGDTHDTLHDIGFRLRGNTSRVSMKKSFKISFNTYIQGRKYKDVEKLNLNGEHNDPSVSRSLIYWYILREAGLPGARANHARLFINGNYFGLYANIEHIDEEWLKTYYGDNDGNLYKCLYPADLNYRGEGQQVYKFHHGDYRVYELKTNEEKDDYSDLANFIKVLNKTPLKDLPCALEEVFNVQAYLKVAAIDVLTGNWDGYAFNKNNFYLYHDPATGRIDYIPYDVDNILGIDWFNINWATRNVYNWANSNEQRPLFTRLMQVPEYKAQYSYYLKQLIEQVTSDPELSDYLSLLEERARPYVLSDPYYPLDYGFNISTFNDSWRKATFAHVKNGIRPFIQQRNSSTLSQLSSNNEPPIITYISSGAPNAMEGLTIMAHVEDQALEIVSVEYTVNEGIKEYAIMNDQGLDGDRVSGDGFYSATLPVLPQGTEVSYRVMATDNTLTSLKPCNALSYTYPAGENGNNLTVWPNPVKEKRIFLSQKTAFKIYDTAGRLLMESYPVTVADLSQLNEGFFILETPDGSVVKLVIAK